MRILVLSAALLSASIAFASEPVTVDNFVRAESDHMFRMNMEMWDLGTGEFAHLREPTTPDKQPVIRMNQDTLYSAIWLDLSSPATITMPEVGGAIYVHAGGQPGSLHVRGILAG